VDFGVFEMTPTERYKQVLAFRPRIEETILRNNLKEICSDYKSCVLFNQTDICLSQRHELCGVYQRRHPNQEIDLKMAFVNDGIIGDNENLQVKWGDMGLLR